MVEVYNGQLILQECISRCVKTHRWREVSMCLAIKTRYNDVPITRNTSSQFILPRFGTRLCRFGSRIPRFSGKRRFQLRLDPRNVDAM